ncbi:MAG: tripartite tricarboxylate transporter TctB family protein [Syntrophales bacterium]|nr:tripartite tricarboxylate transporter TctB family protein [Syntrophales bacterium]
MKKTYIVSNLFWIAFSIAVCSESLRLGIGSFSEPGSAFLPFYAGLLLGILALVSLIGTLRKSGEVGESPWAKINFLKLGIVVVALFLYVAVLSTLGFVIATFLLLLLLFRIMEPYKWTKVLFASLITIAVTYGFFEILLKSRLPRGFLDF